MYLVIFVSVALILIGVATPLVLGRVPPNDLYGLRVPATLEDEEVWFEWITFAADTLLGASAPPVAPRSERDVVPLPTWVELAFEPADGGTRTAVHFAHYGFREGARWEASYRWFSRAWAGVLESLKAQAAAD